MGIMDLYIVHWSVLLVREIRPELIMAPGEIKWILKTFCSQPVSMEISMIYHC